MRPSEEACSLVSPVQNDDYLTFFLFPITFPYDPRASDHSTSLSPKYLSPLPLGRQVWDLFSLSSFGCLRTNALFVLNLVVSAFWLAVSGQTNLVRNKTTQFVVIYYGSPRQLIQLLFTTTCPCFIYAIFIPFFFFINLFFGYIWSSLLSTGFL